jgi:hypothetical protein
MHHVPGSGSIDGHDWKVFVERAELPVRVDGTCPVVVKVESLVKGLQSSVWKQPYSIVCSLGINAADLFEFAAIEVIEAVFVASDDDDCSYGLRHFKRWELFSRMVQHVVALCG